MTIRDDDLLLVNRGDNSYKIEYKDLKSSDSGTGDNGYWNRTGTELSPANAGDDLSTTGDIDTTGSIKAAGRVEADVTSSGTSYAFVGRSSHAERGTYYASNDNGGPLFQGTDGSTTNVTIGADGNATFSGQVEGNKVTNSDVTADINGGLFNAKSTTVNNAAVRAKQYTAGGYVFSGADASGTSTSYIKDDGSITAAGEAKFGETIYAKGESPSEIVFYGLQESDAGSFDPSNAKVTITAGGNATFAGQVSAVSLHGQYSIVTTEKTNNQGIFVGSDSQTSPTAANSNIHLAGDGSATFAGLVELGAIGTNGTIGFARASDGNVGGYVGFSSGNSFRINNTYPDGVIEFYTNGGPRVEIDESGSLKLGTNPSASPNITLNSNGSATFAGSITASGVIKTDNRLEVNVAGDKGNADDTFISYQEDGSTAGVSMTGGGAITAAGNITAAGSATFAGQVTSPSVSLQSTETTAGTSYFACSDEVGGYSSKIIFYTGGSATFAGNGRFGRGRSGETMSANDAFSIETNNASGKSRAINIYGESDIPSTYEAFVIRHDGNQVIKATYDGSITAASSNFQVEANGSTLIGGTLPSSPNIALGSGGSIKAKGQIESTSDGFKFPDGTVQTTAATSGGASGSVYGWVTFNSDGSISASSPSVSAVTKTGGASYRVDLADSLGANNYAWVGACNKGGNYMVKVNTGSLNADNYTCSYNNDSNSGVAPSAPVMHIITHNPS